MKLHPPIRGVVFDLDGVLLDTETIYTEVTNVITQRHGKVYDWSVKSEMIGRGALESAEYLVKALDLPIRAEDYLAERDPLLEVRFAATRAMPGAEAFSREIHRRGIPIAVATSTGARLFAVKAAAHRDWFSIFRAVVCGDDPRVVRGKPAPDIFLAAAAELGVPPASCLVFEDSPHGLAAALAAGMRAVAIPDPNMDRARYVGAERIIGGYHECPLADFGL